MNTCYECKNLTKSESSWGDLPVCSKDLRKKIPYLHPCKGFEKVEEVKKK